MQPFVPVDPTLLVLGDIRVGQVWVVTPFGSAPMHGAQFHLQESYVVEERIPQWAIITAIVSAFLCLLGLLFLLAKEPVTVTVADITVTSGAFRHTTRLRVGNPMQMQQLWANVGAAQQMADNAPVAG